MGEGDYVTRIHTTPQTINAATWDGLLETQSAPSPFMRHAYLTALHDSGSATTATGWGLALLTLETHGALAAGCVVYLKDHSYGEYVFDWTWASAYQQHGVPYYPKAVVTVPFTPVPGTRLLARDAQAREMLLKVLLQWCIEQNVSSLHMLFASDDDITPAIKAGLMLRHTVQFHWTNTTRGYTDFEDFLATLSQEKRKKIRQERRKVTQAGITFRVQVGNDITKDEWDFFYRCYAQTYLAHGNPPYLNRNFFQRVAQTMPENWVMFIAERATRPIASSLIAIGDDCPKVANHQTPTATRIAYGRYWGTLEAVNCLHFEACYYQPLQWCIEQGYHRFEGGAQGEHKMARALLPIKTTSAHWLAHPAFSNAVARFLKQEDEDIGNYLAELLYRSPFRDKG